MIIEIDNANSNIRIDVALSNLSDFSRSMIQKFIHKDAVLLNNEPIQKANFVTQTGQMFEVVEQKQEHIISEPGKIDIIFEDEEIIVLNKSAPIVTHPGAGNSCGTLMNFLAHHCRLSELDSSEVKLSDIGGIEKLGVIHRLDKGVSGCIIFAKTNKAHILLNEQFQNRNVKKEYIAISYNKPSLMEALLEDYISRSPFNRKKMRAIEKVESAALDAKSRLINYEDFRPPTGKYSAMQYKVSKVFHFKNKATRMTEFVSVINCFPSTGRMHQIRIQLSSRGMPIVGDNIYGNKQKSELIEILGERIALHAKRIEFTHPTTSKLVSFEAPLPLEFANLQEYCELRQAAT